MDAISDSHSVISAKVGLVFSLYNGNNRSPRFVLGGPAMRILVPLKPVVLVWGLLSAMILVGFIASSMLQGKNPLTVGSAVSQSKDANARSARAEQQAKRSHEAVESSSR